MMEITEKDLQSGEQKSSQKVDLHIRHDEEEEGSLNLLNIFTNMKKRRKIYVWVLIISFLVGTIIPFMLYQKNETNPSAIAVLSFNYEGAEEGKAPNGSALNISDLQSTYVLQNALKSVKLSTSVSISSVASALTIVGILTEDSQQQMELIQTLAQKDSKYLSMLQEMELNYRAQYLVYLKNSFDNGTTLSNTDLSHLLTAITESYSTYFIDTYKSDLSPKTSLETVNFSKLDYLESLDELKSDLSYLQTYCENIAKLYPSFRGSDGLSFTDLKNVISTVNGTQMDYTYSFVYLKNVSKDPTALLANYQYELREVDLKLSEVNKNIQTVDSSIAQYKDDKVVVSTTDGTDEKSASVTTDYYNSLISQQVALNQNKTELERQQAILTDKITQISGSTPSQADLAKAEADVTEAVTNVKSLYTLVKNHATELSNSREYQDAMVLNFQTMEAQMSIFSYAKKIAIGMLGGLFVGFCAWGVDGLILEIKDSKKRKEENA